MKGFALGLTLKQRRKATRKGGMAKLRRSLSCSRDHLVTENSPESLKNLNKTNKQMTNLDITQKTLTTSIYHSAQKVGVAADNEPTTLGLVMT